MSSTTRATPLTNSAIGNLSIIAQAKPATVITSAPPPSSQQPSQAYNTAAHRHKGGGPQDGLAGGDMMMGLNCDRINGTNTIASAFKSSMEHSVSDNQLRRQQELLLMRRSESSIANQPKLSSSSSIHIEDENLIDKQNASNQMRQAAVMVAALADQQATKQRLSATERLAMTAKKSSTMQSVGPTQNGHQHQQQQDKPAPATATRPQANDLKQQQAPAAVGPCLQQVPPRARTTATIQQQQPPQRPMATPQHKPPVPPPLSSKLSTTSLPTLETLLAVQRQLQRHTRKNLNSTTTTITELPKDLPRETRTQDPSTNNTNNHTDLDKLNAQQVSENKLEHVIQEKKCIDSEHHNGSNKRDLKQESIVMTNESERYFSKQFPNLSRIPPINASEQNNYVTSIHETYDKELPPLPASISPSSYTNTTTSDESQMSSLESQSSPPTSLVSLPPPPPPISSYLQQYDEATSQSLQQQQLQNSCHHKPNSTSALLAADCSPSEVPSVKQPLFPPVPPVKQQHQPTQTQRHIATSRLSPIGVRSNDLSAHLATTRATSQLSASSSNSVQARRQMAAPQLAPRAPNHLAEPSRVAQQNVAHEPSGSNSFQSAMSSRPSLANQRAMSCVGPAPPASSSSLPPSSSSSTSRLPEAFSSLHLTPPNSASLLPPPPLTFAPQAPDQQPQDPSSGCAFDQPDCASFRFPTPPPPELLFDDDANFGEPTLSPLELGLESRVTSEEEQKRNDSNSTSTKDGTKAHDANNNNNKSNRDEDEDEDEDNDDEDDEFECRIPTPPASQKSLSFASFQDLNNCQTSLPARHLDHFFGASNPDNSQQQRALFNSSSFSAPFLSADLCKPAASNQNHRNNLDVASLLSCHGRQQAQRQPPNISNSNKIGAPQLTVCVGDDETRLANASGLLSTAPSQHRHHHYYSDDANHRRQLVMNAMVASVASSSSPSSSSDGDGHSSNSSSSTSGVPSSIDSPSLKSESDFSYGPTVARPTVAGLASGDGVGGGPIIGCSNGGPTATSIIMMTHKQRQQHASTMNFSRRDKQNVESSFAHQHHHHQSDSTSRPQQHQQTLARLTSTAMGHQRRQQQQQQQQQQHQLLQQQHLIDAQTMAPPPTRPLTTSQRRDSSSSLNSTSTVASGNGSVTSASTTATSATAANKPNKLPRPVLKQKKSVSFSDRVELVACAEEQCDSHLPNPLLARVLAAQTNSASLSIQRQQQQRHSPNGIAS